MIDAAGVRSAVMSAFASVEGPPSWCLSCSLEGEEPDLVRRAFRSAPDWRSLSPAFLDAAPDGFASALSFFSDEAFRFYLPAYLLAALGGQLKQVDVVYHLVHGLDSRSREALLNPARYGARTWCDARCYRFSVFTQPQCAAIVAFLRFIQASPDCFPGKRTTIQEALDYYWLRRAG